MTMPLNSPDDQQTADELSRVEAEPLLPIEKQLIVGSLLLGLLLLVLLWWISMRYFPAKSESSAAHEMDGARAAQQILPVYYRFASVAFTASSTIAQAD